MTKMNYQYRDKKRQQHNNIMKSPSIYANREPTLTVFLPPKVIGKQDRIFFNNSDKNHEHLALRKFSFEQDN